MGCDSTINFAYSIHTKLSDPTKIDGFNLEKVATRIGPAVARRQAYQLYFIFAVINIFTIFILFSLSDMYLLVVYYRCGGCIYKLMVVTDVVSISIQFSLSRMTFLIVFYYTVAMVFVITIGFTLSRLYLICFGCREGSKLVI